MAPHKTKFFTCDGKYYVVLEDTKGHAPSFPIACIDTGLGHEWEEFTDKKKVKTSVDLNALCATVQTEISRPFHKVSPSTLLLIYDGKGRDPFIGLRLIDDFTDEKNESKVFLIDRTRCFAVNLCSGTICFGEMTIITNINAMKNWPVKPIINDIKSILI